MEFDFVVGYRRHAHRIVHGYDVVNFDIVWSIVRNDLPPLIVELDRLIDGGR